MTLCQGRASAHSLLHATCLASPESVFNGFLVKKTAQSAADYRSPQSLVRGAATMAPSVGQAVSREGIGFSGEPCECWMSFLLKVTCLELSRCSDFAQIE